MKMKSFISDQPSPIPCSPAIFRSEMFRRIFSLSFMFFSVVTSTSLHELYCWTCTFMAPNVKGGVQVSISGVHWMQKDMMQNVLSHPHEKREEDSLMTILCLSCSSMHLHRWDMSGQQHKGQQERAWSSPHWHTQLGVCECKYDEKRSCSDGGHCTEETSRHS